MAVQGVADFLVPMNTAGAASAGAGAMRLGIPFASRLLGVAISAGTAPAGADLILDVNVNGTTVFPTQSGRPRILAGANAGTVQLSQPVTLAPGDYITIDVDQVGSGTAGSNLGVTIWMEKA